MWRKTKTCIYCKSQYRSCFRTTTAELGRCNRPHGLQSLKYLLCVLLQKKEIATVLRWRLFYVTTCGSGVLPPGSKPSTLNYYVLIYALTQWGFIMPILQMRKLRHGEEEQFVHGVVGRKPSLASRPDDIGIKPREVLNRWMPAWVNKQFRGNVWNDNLWGTSGSNQLPHRKG